MPASSDVDDVTDSEHENEASNTSTETSNDRS